MLSLKRSILFTASTVVLIGCCCVPQLCANLLIIEDFYSHSFAPNALEISYHIENQVGVYYNLTIHQSFPGKILMNLFIRKYCKQKIYDEKRNNDSSSSGINNSLSNWPCKGTATIMRYNNLDFCETLDFARNFTTENYSGEDFLQTTFVTSCPLVRGDFYFWNATIAVNTIPRPFDKGRYLVQFELIQVFREITKLLTTKAICFYDND